MTFHLDIRSVARAMNGIVSHGAALVPGPGHSAHDRSLSIKIDLNAPEGFVVHSFAGDNPIVCRDFVRRKLALPAWQPTHSGTRQYRQSANGLRGTVQATKANAANETLPARTPPDAEGKPIFREWDANGPPRRADELRRHIYLRNLVPIRVKIKNSDGGYINWYRVVNNGAIGWQARKPVGYVQIPYIGAVNPFDPELAHEQIYWPEGEKDCNTLAKINLPAFTFGGCGDGLPDDATVYFIGRHIVILADNDHPGRDHAEKKAAFAHAAGAASVRIVQFPDLSTHGDVSDFINAGGTADELMQRANDARLWQPPPQAATHDQTTQAPTGESSLFVRRASEIEPQSIQWLWPFRIAIGKQTLIAGEPGLGKSQLTIALAAAVSTGGHWPCDEGRASLGSVIILSAEDDAADTIVPRLSAAGADLDRVLIVFIGPTARRPRATCFQLAGRS
jgi:hypothetical protein